MEPAPDKKKTALDMSQQFIVINLYAKFERKRFVRYVILFKNVKKCSCL